jgi:uncharacterized protein
MIQTLSLHLNAQFWRLDDGQVLRFWRDIILANLHASACSAHSTFANSAFVNSNRLHQGATSGTLARPLLFKSRNKVAHDFALGIIKSMDNRNVAVEEMELGRGLIATALIRKDEVVAVFDGPTYFAPRTSALRKEIADHAIQIAPNLWKDSYGKARCANHSCEPNLGYRGRDTLVAMRTIQPGERLTVDYEMTERSDWRMVCRCKTPSCRGMIGTFDNLPPNVRAKYGAYISSWLREELQAAA